MGNCLIFAIFYFQIHKKLLKKLLLEKEKDDAGDHQYGCFQNYDTAK